MAIIIDFTAAVGVRNHLYRVSIRILFCVPYPGKFIANCSLRFHDNYFSSGRVVGKQEVIR